MHPTCSDDNFGHQYGASSDASWIDFSIISLRVALCQDQLCTSLHHLVSELITSHWEHLQQVFDEKQLSPIHVYPVGVWPTALFWLVVQFWFNNIVCILVRQVFRGEVDCVLDGHFNVFMGEVDWGQYPLCRRSWPVRWTYCYSQLRGPPSS